MKQSGVRSFLFVVPLAHHSLTGNGAKSETKVEASALLVKAKHVMDIRAPGSPPIHLVAHPCMLTPYGGWAAVSTINDKGRFKPAACMGNPVPVEIPVEINSRLY